MVVKYSKYELSPKSALNRFDTKIRQGCYFSLDDKFYLDYCPWIEFGDLSVNDILYKIQTEREIPKLFTKLFTLDSQRNNIKKNSFLNHDLNSHKFSSIVKVKCSAETCLSDLFSLYPQDVRLKLDFNNSMTFKGFIKALSEITSKDKKRIFYVEDPCIFNTTEWKLINQEGIDLASDRNPYNGVAQFIVYKPGIDLKIQSNLSQKTIFSSYMGSQLNNFHTYLEAMKLADLELHHGINTGELFEDNPNIFTAEEGDRFSLNFSVVDKMYEKLQERVWTTLL